MSEFVGNEGDVDSRLFRTHVRVVGALLVREMASRFGSKPGGYLWAFLDPAAHITLLSLLFGSISRRPVLGSSFPLFFATGFLAFQFYAAMSGYINGAVKSNRSLLSYPSVAPIDTILARLILQLVTTVVVAAIVLAIISAMLPVPPTLNWIALSQAVVSASAIGLGIGLFNNVAFQNGLYEKVFKIVTRPLYLISGVFFLPDALPYPYRDIVLLNPLCHVVMLFRVGFYPEYNPQSLDVTYLSIFSAITVFVGMSFFTFFKSTLRSE